MIRRGENTNTVGARTIMKMRMTAKNIVLPILSAKVILIKNRVQNVTFTQHPNAWKGVRKRNWVFSEI